MNRRPFTHDDLVTAQDMRQQGMTYKQIADVLGASKSTVALNLNPRYKEKAAARNEKHQHKSAEYSRRWRENNPETALERQRKYRARKVSDPMYRAKRALYYNDCVTPAEQIAAAWTGKCYLCGVPEIECNGRLCMEHNHETKEFRGWACSKCNMIIAVVENHPEIVDKIQNQILVS